MSMFGAGKSTLAAVEQDSLLLDFLNTFSTNNHHCSRMGFLYGAVQGTLAGEKIRATDMVLPISYSFSIARLRIRIPQR